MMVEVKENKSLNFKDLVNKIGLPTLIIGVFWLILLVTGDRKSVV